MAEARVIQAESSPGSVTWFCSGMLAARMQVDVRLVNEALFRLHDRGEITWAIVWRKGYKRAELAHALASAVGSPDNDKDEGAAPENTR